MDGGSQEELLATYFQTLTGAAPSLISALRPHASARRMYRLSTPSFSCIGVINASQPENDAFVSFARHFRASGLPVPEVYLYRPEYGAYLQSDLGDATLLSTLLAQRALFHSDFPPTIEKLYRSVLEILPRFQIEAGAMIDYERCYPNSNFSDDALNADMALFTQELVPRIIPSFNTEPLLRDFVTLIEFLADARGEYFLYRDFQSRNIMIVNDAPWFIDFQGGRKGPLQYDVVSLLYQASAKIPPISRSLLLNHYLDQISQYTTLDREDFLSYLSAFIVSRMVQVLGVYGKEGLGAGKGYFTASIPTALETLAHELKSQVLGCSLPHLNGCIIALIDALNER